MSVLSYTCPLTSIEVTTGIDTTSDALARMRKLKVSVWCPCCATTHSIPAEDMYFSARSMPPFVAQGATPK